MKGSEARTQASNSLLPNISSFNKNPLVSSKAPDGQTDKDINFVMTKFMQKGYDSLTEEELALTVVNPEFTSIFKRQTGSDWVNKYQTKTLEKLKAFNFDLNFMTSGIMGQEFNPFFAAVIKGDIETLRQYFRDYPKDNLARLVDAKRKSPLHHAAREGQITAAEYLISKGLRVNARDRSLKTPLHYAALYGHSLMMDLLINEGADSKSRDASGRTALHFACSSWSVESVCLLLNLSPEEVHLGDNVGRTPLLYAVWNNTDEQVSIIRTILERKADPNQTDDYGLTALHHAAKGGRSRAIPILIQRGADLMIKDPKYHKTPAEMSKTQRIRELITVYSAGPHYVKKRDRAFLSSAIVGQSVDVNKLTLTNEESYKPVRNPDFKIRSSQGPAIPSRNNTMVPSFLQENLVIILEKLQEVGIKSGQHVRRPYLFTGSWLEGVTSIEQLYDRVKDITANEALLRVFNVMQPYEGPVPQANGQEMAVSNFYGEYFNFDFNANQQRLKKDKQMGENVLENVEVSKIYSQNSALKEEVRVISAQRDRLVRDEKEYQTRIATLEYEKKSSEQKVREYDLLQQQKTSAERALASKHAVHTQELNQLQMKLNKSTEKEGALIELQQELEDRELQLESALQDKAKLLASLKTMKAEMSLLTDKDSMNKQISNLRRRKFRNRPITEQEEAALRSMLSYLSNNPPDLVERLRKEDKNSDGYLNKFEFCTACQKMERDNMETYILSKLAGFEGTNPNVSIDEFQGYIRAFVDGNQKMEMTIMGRFIKTFKQNGMDVQTALDQYDIDYSGGFSKDEFRDLVEELGVELSEDEFQLLFKQLDVDIDNEVSIEEFQAKLSSYEAMMEGEPIRCGGGRQNDPIKLVEKESGRFDDEGKDDSNLGKSIVKTANSKFRKKAKDITSILNVVQKRDSFEQVTDKEQISSFLINSLAKERTFQQKVKLEFSPLVGELKVQIQKFSVFADKLPKGTKKAIMLMRLPGITNSWLEKEIFLHAIESFRFAIRVTIMNVLEENVSDFFMIRAVVVGAGGSYQTVGEGQIEWKRCLASPNTWSINSKVALEQEDPAAKGVSQKLTDFKMQMKWIDSGNKDEFRATISDDYYLKPTFRAPVQESGFLEVVVSSLVLKDAPDLKKLELKISTPDGKSLSMSPVQTVSNQYQFNRKMLAKTSFSAGTQLDSIYAIAKQAGNPLGEVFINWQEAITFSKDYTANKAFLLYQDGKPSLNKLYLKFRFITETQAQLLKASGQDKNVNSLEDSYLRGILKVGIVRARGLIGDEKSGGKMTSDPFVEIKVKDLEKTHKYKTDDVSKNLNPDFFEFVNIPLKLLKEGAVPPLEVKVFDYDFFSFNDELGTCKIDLAPVVKNPCEWGLNQFTPLTNNNKPDTPAGEVYLMAYFVPKGTFDPNLPAIDKETKQPIQWREGAGRLHLRIICAKGLVYLKNDIPQPTVDSFLRVVLPYGKKKETKYFKRTLDPLYKFQYDTSLPKSADEEDSSACKAGKVDIEFVASTGLMSSSAFSRVSIDLAPCLAAPGKWSINGMYPIPGETKQLQLNGLENLGEVYVQAKIVEKGMIDDEQQPEVHVELPKVNEGQIRGTFLVHIVHCKDLPEVDVGALIGNTVTDPFVKVELPCLSNGKKSVACEETPVIWDCLNPIFGKKLLLPFVLDDRQDLQPLKISVFDKDQTSFADLIGTVEVDVATCVDSPNSWMIDKISDIENIKEKFLEADRVAQIYYQVKFLPEGEVDDGSNPPLQEDLSQTAASLKKEGELIVRVIHAKGLIRADGDSSDPYVTLELPGRVKMKTPVIKKSLTPAWNFEHRQKVLVHDVRNLKSCKLEVWDKDGFLNGDDQIGFADIDFRPVLKDEGVWVLNEVIELKGSEKKQKKLNIKNFGSIYLQALFLKTGQELTKEPEVKEDIEQVKKNALQKGTIQIRAVHAKGLLKTDSPGMFSSSPASSDPYVYINWPNGKKSQTEVRKATVTPKWEQDFSSEVSLDEYNLPTIKIQIYDSDGFMNSDDLIGSLLLETEPLVHAPNTWAQNGNLKLEGPPKYLKKFKNFGEIYIQARFLKEGTNADKTFPEVSENLEEVILAHTFEGNLQVKVVHATNIPISDSGMEGSKSDPYVEMTLPDKKNWSSKVQKNSLNPIWNEILNHPISIVATDIEPIQIKLKDKDTFSGDDLLATAIVNVQECFAKPGEWKFNSLINMMGPDWKELETPKDIRGNPKGPAVVPVELYIQVRYLPKDFDASKDKTPEAPLVKDLAKEIVDLRVDGQFVVYLVHAKDLIAVERKNRLQASVSYGSQKSKTKETKDTRNPLFNHKALIPVSLEGIHQVEKLKVKIKWVGTLYSNDVGETEIDLSECAKTPLEWKINQKYQLTAPEDLLKKKGGDTLGEIYLQARFIPKDHQFPSDNSDSLEMQPKLLEKIEEVKSQSLIKGKVIFYVVHAQGLIPEDGKSLDPYVYLTFNGKNQKTKYKKGLDVTFKEKLSFDVDFEKVAEVPKVSLKVYDSDYFGDDITGQVEFSIEELFAKPGEYTFNQILTLQGPKKLLGKYRSFGKVYLQAKYLPEGSSDTDNFAPELENIDKVIQASRVKGTLHLYAVSGSNLVKGDSTGGDPYLFFTFGNGKTGKTNYKSKTNNPIWKEKVSQFLDLPKGEASFVNVKIYNSNYMTDGHLGTVDIDIGQCFNNKRQWAVNKAFKVGPPKKEKLGAETSTKDYGSLYIMALYSEQKLDDKGKAIPENIQVPEESLLKKELLVVESSKEKPEKVEKKKEVEVQKKEDMGEDDEEEGDGFDDIQDEIDDEIADEIDDEVAKPKRKTEQSQQEEKKEEPSLKGSLKINLVKATNVVDQDSWGKGDSDCFVNIKLPDGQTKKSKTINDDLNPVWKEEFVFKIDIPLSKIKSGGKEKKSSTILFNVRDADTLSSDDCGTVNIDIGNFIGKSGQWVVNGPQPIIFKGKESGTLYLQIKYMLEGEKDDGKIPEVHQGDF